MDDSGTFVIALILLLGYFMADLFMGIEDDVVMPDTYARAVERCERNDGLRYLEQSGGMAAQYHTVKCNDGAEFEIPRWIEDE